MGSELWWFSTGIQSPNLLLESQGCYHYATGAAPVGKLNSDFCSFGNLFKANWDFKIIILI